MGYESYNFEIQFSDVFDINKCTSAFLSMNYSSCKSQTLEKFLKGGFIEVLLNYSNISIRTAKANDTGVIAEIFKDTNTLKDIFQFDLFDLQLKKIVSPSCTDEVILNFIRLREEFQAHYPNVKYPIRCDDVFSNV